jgi:endonuclease/exonuclease/phosphatase family metal-dependent hydrolase
MWQLFPRRAAGLLLCVAVLGLGAGCGNTGPRSKPPPTIRVMTFNIHHGEGLDGKIDLPRIAEVIRRERADLVALQEVDKGVLRTGRRDLPEELAALTGLTCVFSNNFHYQGGEYGNAILTRFPVLSATNSHFQMVRTNEQRGILQVAVDAYGRPLVFMSTHVDYRADDTERLLNLREIAALTRRFDHASVILCGDFNDTPNSRVHQQLKLGFDDTWELAGDGAGWTYPSGNPRKRIDYIWIARTARLKPTAAHVPESAASDHRPVVVELRFE